MGGIGGHGHNDVLSFDLWAAGAPLLVDSGTFTYTADPAARQYMRSTAAHNAVRVDGEETSRLAGERWLWQISNDAHPAVEGWSTSAGADLLTVSHDGYTRLRQPVVHRRSFRLDKQRQVWRIHDELEGSGEHLVELFFHPAVPEASEEGAIRLRAPRGDVLLFPPSGLSLRREQGWLSRGYGHREAATVLVYAARSELPLRLETSLVLAPSGTSLAEARSLVRDS
jgi:uncharacterized heparinase superfamily protein